MTKRFTVVIVIVLYFLAASPAWSPAHARDTWVSVRSKNFLLVGNASEKKVRQVASRLEQFREVFSRILPRTAFTSPVPTIVVVFKSDSSYKPFKPVVDGKMVPVAGFFQPGREVNYITLTTEKSEENPYSVIFHEYVHLLVNNMWGRSHIPAWFNEGLAEYYSTFDIEDDRKIYLGNLISSHLQLLRTSQLVPLERLFAIDYNSLDRDKHKASGLLYAQSWALIHYLIQGNQGKRVSQLGVFLDHLSQNVPADKAFRQAFQTDYAGMEKELRDYLRLPPYRAQIITFEKKIEFRAELKTIPITEAEAQAFLGDLLFHIQRPDDAKSKLEAALALDSRLAMAHATFGMLLIQQEKFAEAKEHLQQALTESPSSYLAHYYYAYALSRELTTDGQLVYDLPPETARRMRAELVRSIELKPDFPESYHLLAFVNLVTGEQLDESIGMIRRAIELSPGSEEFLFVQAQLYIRKQDVEGARRLILPLAANGADPKTRARAESLLARISSIQEAMARFRTAGGERSGEVLVETQTDKDTNTGPDSHLRSALRKPKSGERQIQAMLVRIDCDAKGIVVTLRLDGGLVRLRASSFEEIGITTFSSDVGGEITCGVRKPENAVIVCYLPESDVRARTKGTIRSLEFVPSDFKLNP